ncbi:MAG: hypothetical protein OEY19_09120 [Gammaproteobacteria bacterium]|nr:hypothetical protein [Gammaproteobacteria bacterium]MDH5629410.1 hypothetical protein [Gammaproteobacteria bacterium]
MKFRNRLFIIISILVSSNLYADNLIHACAHKKSGALRIVEDASVCLKSENVVSLSSHDGSSTSKSENLPKWTLVEVNRSTGERTPVDDIVLDQFPYNDDGSTGAILLNVDILDGTTAWVPGVYSRANGRVTPTYQGLDINSYTVLAFEAGSSCSGEPIAIILRSQPEDTKGPSRNKRSPFITAAYDSVTGKIYRAGGGNVGIEGLVFDIRRYGYDKGWLPSELTTCDKNVVLADDYHYILDGENSYPSAFVFYNPFHWANNPYFDPNYQRYIGLLIE